MNWISLVFHTPTMHAFVPSNNNRIITYWNKLKYSVSFSFFFFKNWLISVLYFIDVFYKIVSNCSWNKPFCPSINNSLGSYELSVHIVKTSMIMLWINNLFSACVKVTQSKTKFSIFLLAYYQNSLVDGVGNTITSRYSVPENGKGVWQNRSWWILRRFQFVFRVPSLKLYFSCLENKT